ncbi:hypothetical protein A3A71_00055 [Candidatus Berkelbacteria bacterium RIFCSPLOWO2_01_FULL_50_28]|uniref:Uncharacterized protein n=1 Tax=Candidatus Berkelbacteria bacterium RIFCSPLOWO2_01_FULL_50_28 TaxID=1797471 RepID=A0A1F5EAP0_9BACT|nr:MAG: hypothetical protein A2807_03240 [Candidatus Berkelbacteria bacterium RIFCSPHIGHO2_01_FULL_50_36]OGD62413.1 MAG: hypothetical protein A3F39_01775 [Candidatus Berkelbacteria bacterium RIFCSPHIGHO2_12_FULL_50_11]OGD64445.1 MAG: hypothetical protein A3A71_00055 [Candidatus Berkelbacteria bacterium RIFCSPLOWO2_01_FULL_50_28]
MSRLTIYENIAQLRRRHIDLLFRIGVLRYQDRGLKVQKSISRTLGMYEQSLLLARSYSTRPSLEFHPNTEPEGRRACAVDKLIRNMGLTATLAQPLKTDIVRNDFDEMVEKTMLKNPQISHGYAVYLNLSGVMDIVKEGSFYSSDIKVFPSGPNPLYEMMQGISSHTVEAKLKPDPIERTINDWSSPLHPPNCLANAVTMVSLLRCLGFRFYLASGLRLASSDCRNLRLEALTRALKLAVDVPQLSFVVAPLREKIDNIFQHDMFDWMYHHFIVVQLEATGDEWAILDPFMYESVYAPFTIGLTWLADELDARRKDYPGLAVPIDFTGSLPERQLTRLRGRLTRAEQYAGNMTAAYLAKASQIPEKVTLADTYELFAGNQPATASLKWLVRQANPKRYQDREALVALGVDLNNPDSPQPTFNLEEQLAMAQNLLKREGVPWLITRAINIGLIGASLDGEELIRGMGHSAFEIYADTDYMLGLLLSSAVVASTGLRALSPQLLQLTSSQLIWQEVAEAYQDFDSISLRVARCTADSFIGSMPESWLHPLVAKRRQLLGLA